MFDEGTFGYIGGSEFDPDDILDEGQKYEDLFPNGKEPIGNIYIDRGMRTENSTMEGATSTTRGRS